MNNRQNAKLNAAHSVEEFMISRKADLDSKPKYSEYLQGLKKSMEKVETVSITRQSLTIETKSDPKHSKKSVLEEVLCDHISKMKFYAVESNDAEILSLASITQYKVHRMKDNELYSYAELVYEKQEPIKAALILFEIDAAERTELKTAIENFYNSLGKPEAAKSHKTLSTEELENAVEEMWVMVEKIDIMVATTQREKPMLYEEFKNVSRIDVSSRVSSIHGTITDANTGLGLPGTKIMLKLINSTQTIEWLSAEFGGYRIQNAPTGEYKVYFSRVGYESTEKFAVIDNINSLKLDVAMKPKSEAGS